MLGPKCSDPNAWTQVPRPEYSDLIARTQMHGPKCLDPVSVLEVDIKLFYTNMQGPKCPDSVSIPEVDIKLFYFRPMCKDPDVWTHLPGPKCLDPHTIENEQRLCFF